MRRPASPSNALFVSFLLYLPPSQSVRLPETSKVVRTGFSRRTVSRVYQKYVDCQQKISDWVNCKQLLALAVRGERRLRRIVRSQRSQTLVQITTQLNDGSVLQSEQGVKGHHTAPTSLTELRTALVSISQVIPVKHFQKLVESMTRRAAAVIKGSGGPNRY
ncbi:hypothetical protein TNCV_3879041 [Trichonephila clavipes]|nr:hypothetical protein TNCV_3879041 [Trichonephila clavipes]